MQRDKTVWVMRHGETIDNVAQIITAQADSPLTALGLDQAAEKGRLLRQYVQHLQELAFVASPLHRACVTTEVMRAAVGLPGQGYATDPRLMEMNFGDWTGRSEGDDRHAPDQPSAHEQWDLVTPYGESQSMVHARVGRFLQSVDTNIAIVCHARVLGMVRMHLLDLSREYVLGYDQPPNAGVLRLSNGVETWF